MEKLMGTFFDHAILRKIRDADDEGVDTSK